MTQDAPQRNPAAARETDLHYQEHPLNVDDAGHEAAACTAPMPKRRATFDRGWAAW
jgi:hypothetical protein